MTAKELNNIIYFDGQVRDVRKLCVERKLIPIEQLAIMNRLEVYQVIAKHFEILGVSDSREKILLVEKDKWDEVQKYIIPLCR